MQPFKTQLFLNLPSILLNSALIPNNPWFIEFWLLVIVLFEKYHNLQAFAKSYYAKGVKARDVIGVLARGLLVNLVYFGMAGVLLGAV
jgi:hypothetical protein